MAISNPLSPYQQAFNAVSSAPQQAEEVLILQEMDGLKFQFRNSNGMSPYDYHKRMDDLASRLHHVRQAAAINAAQMAQQLQPYQQSALSQLTGIMPSMMKYEKPKPVPFENAFGETLAWRVWKVGAFPFLTSTFKTEFIWMPGTVEVAEGIGNHNQCGFHAWNNLKAAHLYCIEVDAVCVVGQVKLWGTVIHHEKGYRAEKAKIVSLDTLSFTVYPNMSGKDGRKWPHTDAMLANIRKHYGLPVGGTA